MYMHLPGCEGKLLTFFEVGYLEQLLERGVRSCRWQSAQEIQYPEAQGRNSHQMLGSRERARQYLYFPVSRPATRVQGLRQSIR
jgi:hypothetical protein